MIELDSTELRDLVRFRGGGQLRRPPRAGRRGRRLRERRSEGGAPKGIFPWYAPGYDSFLGEFPLSHDALIVPAPTSGRPAQPADRARGRAGLPRWCGRATPSSRCSRSRSARSTTARSAGPARPRSATRRTGARRRRGSRASSSTVTRPDAGRADGDACGWLCYLRTADGEHARLRRGQPAAGLLVLRRGAAGLDRRAARQPEGLAGNAAGGRRGADGRVRAPEHVLIGIGATRYTKLGESDLPRARRRGDRAGLRHRERRRFRIAPTGLGAVGRPEHAGIGAIEFARTHMARALRMDLTTESIDPFLPNVQSSPSKRTNSLFQGLEILANFE